MLCVVVGDWRERCVWRQRGVGTSREVNGGGRLGKGAAGRGREVTLPDPWIPWDVQMKWLRDFEEGTPEVRTFGTDIDVPPRTVITYTPPMPDIYTALPIKDICDLLTRTGYTPPKTDICHPSRKSIYGAPKTDLCEPKTECNELLLGTVCRPSISAR